MKSFSDLNLPPALARAVAEMGFVTPTPIQEQAIPVALEGKDLIGCAQTGTGKTAAFGIPLFTGMMQVRDLKQGDALVLVPTRELALQVASVFEDLGKYAPELRTAVLIGGVAMQPQRKALQRRPRIIVATPGRLLDHLRSRTASLAKTGFLILDEADRMLDLGFAPQLREILKFLPRERKTWMFSATLPSDIESLAQSWLKDPVRVQVGPVSQAVPKITQTTREVNGAEKNKVLLDELNARQGTVLVFARTQSRTDRVCRYLETYGVKVARIHGGRTQGQRSRALDGFRDGSYRVLVATDIAARGIDIDHVAHVINFDLPNVPEDYVHRIGRTGRAGREGEALSLISPEERVYWRDIQRLLGGKLSQGAPGSGRPQHGGGRPHGGGGGRPQRGGGRSHPGGRGQRHGQGGQRRDERRDERPAQQQQAAQSPRDEQGLGRADSSRGERGPQQTQSPRGEQGGGGHPGNKRRGKPHRKGQGRRDEGQREAGGGGGDVGLGRGSQEPREHGQSKRNKPVKVWMSQRNPAPIVR